MSCGESWRADSPQTVYEWMLRVCTAPPKSILRLAHAAAIGAGPHTGLYLTAEWPSYVCSSVPDRS
eukprot:363338-Chlamydomonas_euryale.AAC.6